MVFGEDLYFKKVLKDCLFFLQILKNIKLFFLDLSHNMLISTDL